MNSARGHNKEEIIKITHKLNKSLDDDFRSSDDITL